MKCEKCKNKEATVYYRETVNGKTKSWSLCPDCFQKMQEKEESWMETFWKDPFEDFFGNSFFHSLGLPPVKSSDGKTEKRCSLCGCTFDELVEEGKVGCPMCYSVFEEELAESVRRLHGATKHTGRIPGKHKVAFDRKRKILSLERDLKSAVKEERFEDAARIRDELKELKEKGEQSA